MGKYDENIVPATGQNKHSVFLNEDSGLRILFVGNSITRHGKKPEMGWNQECGMAASCLEKDYVHLLVEKIRRYDPHVAYGIAQVAEFEWHFDTLELAPLYQQAADFSADIIVLFFGANVSKDYDAQESHSVTFGDAVEKLMGFLDPQHKAKLYLSQGFYVRPCLDAEKQALAEKWGIPYMNIQPIVQSDEAHGRFNHPSDIGMQQIADTFWTYIEPEVRCLTQK